MAPSGCNCHKLEIDTAIGVIYKRLRFANWAAKSPQNEMFAAILPFDESSPGDEQDLEVTEHSRHPGTDVGNRVIPQHEVHSKEESGDQRVAPAS